MNLNKMILVSLMTSLIFTFVFIMPVNEANAMAYTDISTKDPELYEAISTLSEQKIVFGITSTTFGPSNPAKRGETAQMIVNALGWQNDAYTNPNFSDVPTTHKYFKAIAILASKNIIKGTGNGKFSPDQTLTRSQIAKIITLAFGLDFATSTSTPFKDVQKLSAETQQYIATLVSYKVTTGVTATSFNPNGQMTRSQLARFIFRSIQNSDTSDFEIIGIE